MPYNVFLSVHVVYIQEVAVGNELNIIFYMCAIIRKTVFLSNMFCGFSSFIV